MLKPCPCGKTPEKLVIQSPGGKWSNVSGDCCGEWFIEAKLWYHEKDEAERIAEKFWNESPRGRNPG